MLAYLSLDRVTKIIFSSMYRYSRRLGMIGKIKMWIMFFEVHFENYSEVYSKH